MYTSTHIEMEDVLLKGVIEFVKGKLDGTVSFEDAMKLEIPLELQETAIRILSNAAYEAKIQIPWEKSYAEGIEYKTIEGRIIDTVFAANFSCILTLNSRLYPLQKRVCRFYIYEMDDAIIPIAPYQYVKGILRGLEIDGEIRRISIEEFIRSTNVGGLYTILQFVEKYATVSDEMRPF